MGKNARQKKNRKGPRRKRMNRAGRLQSAKAAGWVDAFQGKNIVRGYARWFGVDLLCAVAELRALGVSISHEQEEQFRATARNEVAARRKTKETNTPEEHPDSDHTFAMIAGYTSGGAPYGVTSEEWEDVEEHDQGEQGRGTG